MISPENYSRFLLDMIHECRIKSHELLLFAKKFPHLRPKICYVMELVVTTALDAEKLRERITE